MTGFKWMGNRADDLIKAGKRILLAFEEAIGFMCGTTVLDKDGVAAALRCAELTAYLNSMEPPVTLTQQLQKIYDTLVNIVFSVALFVFSVVYCIREGYIWSILCDFNLIIIL